MMASVNTQINYTYEIFQYIQEGYWARHIDDGSVNGMLEYYQCPPGYCQCSRVDNDSSACNSIYYYDDDDRQCVCDREGVNMNDYNGILFMQFVAYTV